MSLTWGGAEADICSPILAGSHTKYGFTLLRGDTDKFKPWRLSIL